MSDTPSVFTNFLPTDMANAVEPGDVALLLKKDGRVMAMNFGYDAARLMLPADQMTDDDRAMLEQGKKLFALSLAAQDKRLMGLLLTIASDPDVVDFDTLKAAVTRH